MTNIELTKLAFENAKASISKINPEVLYDITLPGESMITGIIPHLLNNIVTENTKYLEIGTWKGTSAVCALYGNKPQEVTIVDSWEPRFGPTTKDDFIKKCNKYLNYIPNYIHNDCFGFNPLEKNIRDVNAYYYDGEHEYEDHYKALTHYYDSLADEFIYIVDDFNYGPVKPATMDALRDKNITVLYSIEDQYTYTSNGLFVAVCKK